MATTRPFAFNTGSTISGTEQIGNLAIGENNRDYSGDYGGVRWWMGPDEDLGYVIAQPMSSNDQPTQPGIVPPFGSVGFWRTVGFLDSSFIQLSEYVSVKNGTPQTFNSGSDAKVWLNNNGYWTSYIDIPISPTPTTTISSTPTNTPTQTPTNTETTTPTNTPTNTPTVTSTVTSTVTPTPTPTSAPVLSNLVLYYDPSNPSSYSGSGTVINDLSGNGLNGSMSGITFTSPYFTYNGTSSQIGVDDNPLLEPGSGDWTMEVWVNQTTSGNDVVLGKFDFGGEAQNVSYSIRTLGTAYYSQYGSGSGSGPTLFADSSKYTGTTNTWYQIVYVFTNGGTKTIETFVNGTSIGSLGHSLTSILNSTNTLYIGSYNGGEYAQWFDGKIGITRIYNTSLTSSQVLQNFNADKSKYGL